MDVVWFDSARLVAMANKITRRNLSYSRCNAYIEQPGMLGGGGGGRQKNPVRADRPRPLIKRRRRRGRTRAPYLVRD